MSCIPGVVVVINKSQSVYDRYLMEKAYPGKFVMLRASKNCRLVSPCPVTRVSDGPGSHHITHLREENSIVQ